MGIVPRIGQAARKVPNRSRRGSRLTVHADGSTMLGVSMRRSLFRCGVKAGGTNPKRKRRTVATRPSLALRVCMGLGMTSARNALYGRAVSDEAAAVDLITYFPIGMS